MGPSNNIYIPKPCHENWADMTDEQRGRHCEVCDKVVRDFTGMPKSEILMELNTSTEKICGRIEQTNIDPIPLSGFTVLRFPVERMRIFVLAFVLVFGLEAWGISSAEAQTAKPAIESLKKKPQQLRSAVQDTSKNINLKGTILDVYTQEPVSYVRVSLWEGERLIAGVLTNEEGKFEFRVPKTDLHAETYDVRVSHHGRERTDVGIGHDIKELLYFVDASFSISGMDVLAPRSLSIMGDVVMGISVVDYRSVTHFSTRDRASLYRPLDEWLMMNHSEIRLNGRW